MAIKLNMQLPYDPENSFWHIYHREMKNLGLQNKQTKTKQKNKDLCTWMFIPA